MGCGFEGEARQGKAIQISQFVICEVGEGRGGEEVRRGGRVLGKLGSWVLGGSLPVFLGGRQRERERARNRKKEGKKDRERERGR